MDQSRRARPAGVLGMLALVAALEAYVGGHGLEFAAMAHDWAERGKVAARHARGCDVLCLGDSTVKMGVAPRVIEARTGRRCVGLAVTAGPPSVTFYMLRRALDAGARPTAVVFASVPCLLRKAEWWTQDNWRQFLGLREGLDAAWTTGQLEPLVQAVLGRLLPSLATRSDVRGGLVRALGGEGRAWWVEREAHRRNWAFNRGAAFLLEPPAPVDPATWCAENVAADWAPDPAKAAYLERFLALAESRGIRVYWLLPPIHPATQAAQERTGQEPRVERFVRAAMARHRNVVVVDGRRAGYDPRLFLDTIHLRVRGAAALSEGVAAALRRRGEAPASRWVALPAYREPPEDVRLETLEHSRLAAIQEVLRR